MTRLRNAGILFMLCYGDSIGALGMPVHSVLFRNEAVIYFSYGMSWGTR